MKLLAIARKTLVELIREPQMLLMVMGFPILLVLVYYAGFGRSDKGMAEFLKVLVVNEDTGSTAPDGSRVALGEALVDELRRAEFAGKPALAITAVRDLGAAETALREGKAALLVVIPPGFSRALAQAGPASAGESPAEVTLVGDAATDMNYILAASFVEGYIQILDATASGQPAADLRWEFLPGTGALSDFDFGIPGVIVFGALFVILTVSTTLVRENVGKTLRRLRLSRASASDLLGGITAAQALLAAVQIPLTFAVAMAFGFRPQGSLALAMLAGMLVGIAAVGLGLVVACFARNDGEAANIGAGVLLPMAFLSGGMFPLPSVTIATIGGHAFTPFEILPTTHAVEAMRRILVHGAGPAEVAYPLIMLVALTALFFLLGVVLYRRLRMRAA